MQEVFPEIVSDFTDTETGEQTKSVEYSLLIAPLIEATKEQQLQIEELEERIVQLEKLLEELMK